MTNMTFVTQEEPRFYELHSSRIHSGSLLEMDTLVNANIGYAALRFRGLPVPTYDINGFTLVAKHAAAKEVSNILQGQKEIMQTMKWTKSDWKNVWCRYFKSMFGMASASSYLGLEDKDSSCKKHCMMWFERFAKANNSLYSSDEHPYYIEAWRAEYEQSISNIDQLEAYLGHRAEDEARDRTECQARDGTEVQARDRTEVQARDRTEVQARPHLEEASLSRDDSNDSVVSDLVATIRSEGEANSNLVHNLIRENNEATRTMIQKKHGRKCRAIESKRRFLSTTIERKRLCFLKKSN